MHALWIWRTRRAVSQSNAARPEPTCTIIQTDPIDAQVLVGRAGHVGLTAVPLDELWAYLNTTLLDQLGVEPRARVPDGTGRLLRLDR